MASRPARSAATVQASASVQRSGALRGSPILTTSAPVCRTTEPFYADGNASIYAADKRFQQESREPRTWRSDLLHALQLRSHPHDAALLASDGGGRYTEALGTCGHGEGTGGVGGTSNTIGQHCWSSTFRASLIRPVSCGAKRGHRA